MVGNYIGSPLSVIDKNVLILAELFNINFNQKRSFPRNIFALCSWMFIVTKLLVSGTQCINNWSLLLQHLTFFVTRKNTRKYYNTKT